MLESGNDAAVDVRVRDVMLRKSFVGHKRGRERGAVSHLREVVFLDAVLDVVVHLQMLVFGVDLRQGVHDRDDFRVESGEALHGRWAQIFVNKVGHGVVEALSSVRRRAVPIFEKPVQDGGVNPGVVGPKGRREKVGVDARHLQNVAHDLFDTNAVAAVFGCDAQHALCAKDVARFAVLVRAAAPRDQLGAKDVVLARSERLRGDPVEPAVCAYRTDVEFLFAVDVGSDVFENDGVEVDGEARDEDEVRFEMHSAGSDVTASMVASTRSLLMYSKSSFLKARSSDHFSGLRVRTVTWCPASFARTAIIGDELPPP